MVHARWPGVGGMSTRYVETVGTVTDIDGRQVKVGTDHDAVTIGDYRFRIGERYKLMALLDEAEFIADTHECGDE